MSFATDMGSWIESCLTEFENTTQNYRLKAYLEFYKELIQNI